MTKKKLYWIFQLAGWSAYGLIQVIGAIIVAGSSFPWINYAPLILEAFFFLVATHAVRNVIIQRKWLHLGMTALIPRVVILALIAGIFAFVVRITAIYATGMYQANIFNISNILGNIGINTFMVFLWCVFYFIYHYFESYNKSLQYEAAIHEIELNSLKSQLNPHFIFNALNSIRAMIDDEPEKSKSAITQLSNILRNSLATDKTRLTSFSQEFNTVKDYLSLESIRYEERLKVIYDIHPSSFSFSIPPLMIQTLVENGIKHGISRLKEGGMVLITTSLEEGNLKLRIRNSGYYIGNPQKSPKGLGIQNTIKRLHLIYGDRASFNIYNEKDSMVTTEIILPPAPVILNGNTL